MQPQLAGREATRPQIVVDRDPGLAAQFGDLVVDAVSRRRSRRVVQGPHLVVGREGADGDHAPGTHGRAMPRGSRRRGRRVGRDDHREASKPNAPWQSESAASNSPSKRMVRASGARSWRRRGRRRPRARRIAADVDAVDDHAPTGEGVGVSSGSAADVEHAHAGFEPQASIRKSISCSVPRVNEYRR